MRVIFFGTPTIAAVILEHLIKKKIDIIAVVTKPDKKRGRDQKMMPTPVKEIAEKYHLPLYQPIKARDPEFIQTLKSLHADLFAVAAYSEIFNETLLRMPLKGCINVHASILPKYRGAAPIERCVMAGEKESGVSIMQMVKELDAGDVYKIVKTPITDEMTAGDLYHTLSEIGGGALCQVIFEIEQGIHTLTPQDHSEATYAHKLSASDGEIDWNKPAPYLHNYIRGVTPKPGAFCFVEINHEKRRLIIKKTQVIEANEGPAGTILNDPGLIIACSEGALRLEVVQLEGKKALTDLEFLRGIPKNNLKF